mmetsp:Transcript_20736/g.47072  ORF Transcript_20736/g.47072 Transcript_20736/m.47072 type:complete len:80 (-) Transcript_20736:1082-1321(-)
MDCFHLLSGLQHEQSSMLLSSVKIYSFAVFVRPSGERAEQMKELSALTKKRLDGGTRSNSEFVRKTAEGNVLSIERQTG